MAIYECPVMASYWSYNYGDTSWPNIVAGNGPSWGGGAHGAIGFLVYQELYSGNRYGNIRSGIPFDCSAVPAEETISEAYIQVQVPSIYGTGESVIFYEGTASSHTGKPSYNAYTGPALNTAHPLTVGTLDIPITSFDWINKGGTSRVLARGNLDVGLTAPTAPTGANWYSPWEADTEKHAKLVITTGTGGGTPPETSFRHSPQYPHGWGGWR